MSDEGSCFGHYACHVPLDAAAYGNRHGWCGWHLHQDWRGHQEDRRTERIYLDVLESAGSIQNVFDVRKKRGVQLGIVQSDVLEYIRDISDDRELKVIATKLAAVYPLYKEEVHVLGDLSLKTLQDLQGKRVAIGPQEAAHI